MEEVRIKIHIPDELGMKECLDWVMGSSKGDLESTFRFISRVVRMASEVAFDETPPDDVSVLVESLRSGRWNGSATPLKNDMGRVIALFFSDFRNIMELNRLSDCDYSHIFRLLSGKVFINARMVGDLTGVVPFECDPYKFWRLREFFSVPMLNCLGTDIGTRPTHYGYGRTTYNDPLKVVSYFFPKWIRRQAMEFMEPGLPTEPVCVDVLPEGVFRTCSFEGRINEIFNALALREEVGSMECGPDPKITASFVRKLTADLSVPQFPVKLAEGRGAPLENWPSKLLVYAYNAYSTYLRTMTGCSRKSVESFLRFVPDTMLNGASWPVIPVMLPLIKGLRKTMAPYCTVNIVRPRLVEIFREIAVSGMWTDVESIERTVICDPGSSLFDWFIIVRRYLEGHAPESKVTDDYLEFPDFWDAMARGFIRGYMAILASAGLLELAFRGNRSETAIDALYPMPELAYVRITDAGRYALRVTDEVKFDSVAPGKFFELDDEHHIVTLLEGGRPFRAFLESVGTMVSSNKYKLTAQSVLSNCSSEKELTDTVDRLKKTILCENAPAWQDLLDEIKERQNVIRCTRETYNCYKVAPGNNRILRVLFDNPRLRKVVILGEDHRLFVPKLYVAEFEDMLSEHGYFL